jgi:selenoprotein W-related protein
MGQELLSTFEKDLGGVLLCPAEEGGVFTVHAEDHLLWDRAADGGFPEIKELKKRVRDILDPSRDLGHIDR